MSAVCPNCHADVPAAKFCNQCGKPMTQEKTPELIDNTWQSRPDEFAARIHISDLEGFFKKKLVVQEGTRALIIDGAENVGEVGPGEYTLDTFLRRINRFGKKKDITAIITKTDDISLEFDVLQCNTKEFLVIDAKAGIDVRLNDPYLFYANMMGSADVFTASDLRQILFRSVMTSLKQSIGQCGVDEMRTDFSLTKSFDAALETALTKSLERCGLSFARVRTFDFKHEAYDEQNRRKGECYLLISKERAELEHRKTMDDIYTEKELQRIRNIERSQEIDNMAASLKVDAESKDLAIDLRRFEEIEKKRRDLVNTQTFSSAEADAQLERFMGDLRKEKLIRDSDLAEVERQFAEKAQDAQSTRAQLLKLLDIAKAEEVDVARAAAKHRQEMLYLEHQIALSERANSADNIERQQEMRRLREEAEHRRTEEIAEVRHKISMQVDALDIQRKEEEKNALHQRKLSDVNRDGTLADAETEDKVGDIKREAERKQDQLNRERLEHSMAMDAALDKRKQEQRDRENEQRRLDQKLAHDRKLDEMKTSAGLEREKMEVMSGLTPEALISLAPREQAAMLTDLQKTKALHGMTEEQILAMAAEKSPAVAAALREKYSSMAEGKMSERERELYEKMAAQGTAASKMVQDTATSAMAQLGQIAVEQARSFGQMGGGQQHPPAGNSGGAGGAPGMGAQPPTVVLRCPACKAENQSNARCCSNCGAAL